MKHFIEEPSLFGDQLLTDMLHPYRAPTSFVHEVTKEIGDQLFKVDDFMCLHQKCPLSIFPCF